MIEISHCKINLGLHILSKREDGFHSLQTVMYPITGVGDIVELQPSDTFTFSESGITVDCVVEKNLCVRAYELMRSRHQIPTSSLHLHKTIAMGAGLGGGSANATAVLKLCNCQYDLSLSDTELEALAAELGSDTAFFVKNKPQMAQGRGEILTPFNIDLSAYYIYIVKPPWGVSTAQAYANIHPNNNRTDIAQILQQPLEQWRNSLINDFEESIFTIHPQLAQIKQLLYQKGAIYVSMSGSGSAIYGIFRNPINNDLPYFYHCEEPKLKKMVTFAHQ